MLTCDLQCNGLKPCETCSKRTLDCTYGVSEGSSEDIQRSPKRRMLEPVPNGLSMGTNNIHVQSPLTNQSHWSPGAMKHESNLSGQTPGLVGDTPGAGHFLDKEDVPKTGPVPADGTSNMVSHASTLDGNEEEATVYSKSRMLLDPKGRLCKWRSLCIYDQSTNNAQ